MRETLFDSITEMDNLWTAWNLVARKKSAPGMDGVTVGKFGRNPEANLRRLQRHLRQGSYFAQPLRGVWVPKPSGGFRPCGTPSVRDRIAQRAFLNKVVPIVDARFSNGSHAYRPARSIHTAIGQVEWARDRGRKWVLESDVEKCFESIEREMALTELGKQLQDERALALAALWIQNGTCWGGPAVKTERGITQGDLISPLVCNVLLDRLDLALLGSGFRPVRYADDFVVPLRVRRQGPHALEVATAALEALGLRVARHKTRFTTFDEGFDFLGTLFVGSLTLARYRTVTPDGRVRYTEGYEPKAPRPHSRPQRPSSQARTATGAFLV